jgi:hypothetical protein
MAKCDKCEELATHGVTDCIQTPQGWREGPMRNGCLRHAIEVRFHMLDGRVLSLHGYELEVQNVAT